MQDSEFQNVWGRLNQTFQSLVVLILWSTVHGYCTHVLKFGLVDDAYIPMIYARNFVEGHGLVFYPGGERVEGYSSPLWMMFLSGCEFLGINLPSASLFFGMMFGFMVLLTSVIIYVLYFFPKGDSIHFLWHFVILFFIVSDVSFMAWTYSGMEASAYSFLLILLLSIIFISRTNKPPLITTTIITLTRPEGIVISLFVIPVMVWRTWTGRSFYKHEESIGMPCVGEDTVPIIDKLSPDRTSKIKQLKLLLIDLSRYFILPITIFILLRWIYFGHPLPNTFYAKHDFAGWEVWVRGYHYVLTFFIPRPLFLFAVLWVFLEQPRFRVNGLLIWGVILTHMAAVIWEGGDHFALHRFLMPIIPLLSILSIRGIELFIHQFMLSRVKSTHSYTRSGYHVLTVIVMLIVIYFHAKQLYEYKANDRYHFSNGAQWFRDEVNWARNWVQVGKWLKEKYPPGTKIAVVTAGAIPYYSELPAIDIMGLNDVTIAHTPAKGESHAYTGHEKSNPEYVLAQKPQWMQLFPLLFFGSQPFPEENLEQLLTYPAQKDLWRHPEFKDKYKYTSRETPYGFISYFERRDLDDGP